MMRFRPNIVVSGAACAWDEDFWAELAIVPATGDASAVLNLTSNCVRCPSLNVNYQTGKGTGTVLKSLQKDRKVDMGHKWSPVFGRYGFLEGREGVRVSVGDEIEVARRTEERTVLRWPGMGGVPKELWWAL